MGGEHILDPLFKTEKYNERIVLVILVWSTFHPIFEETFPYLAIVGGAKLGRIFSSRHLREKKHALKNKRKELNLNLVLNVVQ